MGELGALGLGDAVRADRLHSVRDASILEMGALAASLRSSVIPSTDFQRVAGVGQGGQNNGQDQRRHLGLEQNFWA